MPKKMPKKMTISEAISIYMEEYDLPEIPEVVDQDKMEQEVALCYAEYEKAKRIAATEVAQRVAQEMNIAWDEHDWREYLDKAETDYFTERYIREYFDEGCVSSDPVDESDGPQKNMKAAKRRKQKARSKKRVRQNAINAVKNNAKRGEDDMMFTASRGGYVVENPKSRTMKTERIWNKAEKMKLVDDNTVVD